MLMARGVGWYENGATGLLQFTFLRHCGLLIGCLLALAPKTNGPRFAVPVMVTAILALAALGRETSGATLLFGPLAASVLTAGTIACLHPHGFLAAAPLRYVGEIYSIAHLHLSEDLGPARPSGSLDPSCLCCGWPGLRVRRKAMPAA